MPETIDLLSSSPAPVSTAKTPSRPKSTMGSINTTAETITLLSSSPLPSPSELINNAGKNFQKTTGTKSSYFATTTTTTSPTRRSSSFTTASQLLRMEKEGSSMDSSAMDESDDLDKPPAFKNLIVNAKENVSKNTKKTTATTTSKKGKKASNDDKTSSNSKISGKITKSNARAGSPKSKSATVSEKTQEDTTTMDIFDMPVSQSTPEPQKEVEDEGKKVTKKKAAPKKSTKTKEAATTTKKPRKPRTKPKMDITTLGMYEVPLPPSSQPSAPAPVPETLSNEHNTNTAAEEDTTRPPSRSPSPPPSAQQPAHSRKRSWTPVDETEQHSFVDLSSDTPEKPAFGSIVGNFKCASEQNSNENSRATTAEPMMKKRCLDLVGVTGNQTYSKSRETVVATATEETTTKGKKTKKKFTTISEFAVGQFRKEAEDQTAGSRYDFFATQLDQQSGAGDEDEIDIDITLPKAKGKGKGTTKKKTAAKPRKSKKAEIPLPDLLSPEIAQKAAQDQHLIFGTSSQLIQSERPAGGWNLKVQDGEAVMDDEPARPTEKSRWAPDFSDFENEEDEIISTQTVILPTKVAKENEEQPTYKRRLATAKKGLWQVSADGPEIGLDLSNVEVLDVVDSPVKGYAVKSVNASTSKAKETFKSTQGTIAQAVRQLQQQQQQPLTDKTPNVPPSSQQINPPEKPSELKKSSGNKETGTATSKTKGKSKSKASEPELPTEADRPNFEGFTQLQLAQQLAKYGYKPIKSRNTIIKILNACWDGIIKRADEERERLKNGGTDNSIDIEEPEASTQTIEKEDSAVTAATTITEAAASPKKRGRPRKNSDASDAAPSSLQPAGSKPSKAKGKSKTSTAATSSETAAHDALPSEQIMKIISKAVMAQKPGTTLEKPSFHQRILMYDAIVVEDLVDWLVAEGLPAIGEDPDKVLGTNNKSMYERVTTVHRWCVHGSIMWIKRDQVESKSSWKRR